MSERLQRSFIESTGLGILENWCSRAGITLARPNRQDTPVDVIAINALLRAVPLQMKIVLGGGMTVHQKYLGKPLKVVYVFLGEEAGGSTGELTRFVVLDPESAWELPRQLGLSHDPDHHVTYRWATTTRALERALEPFTSTTPAELSQAIFA